MARFPRTRRAIVRRTAVFLTVLVAGGGLVALEHTATGATTGNPSGASTYHVTSTTKHHSDGGDYGDNHDKHHHGTTSTSTSTTSTTIKKPHDPGHSCKGKHGRHHHKAFKCRAPSGGSSSNKKQYN